MELRLLHTFALAARLSTSNREVEKLIDAGAFPVVRLPGGQVRIDPADVQTWIQQAKQTRSVRA